MRPKRKMISHKKKIKSSRKGRIRNVALKLSPAEAERILKDKNFAWQMRKQHNMPLKEIMVAAQKALRWQALS